MTSLIDQSAVAGLPSALAGVNNRLDVVSAVVEIGDLIWSAKPSKTKWLKCDGSAVNRTTYADLFAVIGISFGAGDGSTTFNLPDPRGRSIVGAGTGSLAEKFAAASVNVSTDVITVGSNADKWNTGAKIQMTTDGTLPTGIAAATDYYVIRASSTTIKLATSLANALAGTAIDITAAGSGNHTITQTLTARAIGDKGGEEAHANTTGEMPSHNHGVTDTGHTHGTSNGASIWTQPASGSALTGGSFGPFAAAGIANAFTGISIQNSGGNGAHNNMSPYLAVGNLFIYAGV